MGKFIDLKQLAQQETFDITLINGDVLNIRKPSEKLLIEFMAYEDTMKENDNGLDVKERAEKYFKIQRDMVCKIMSYNTNEIVVDSDFLDVNEIDFFLQQAILQGYSEFIQELSQSPNLKSPRSRK